MEPTLDFEDKSLNKFFCTNQQPMWIIDPEFKLVMEINDTAAKTLGYDKEGFFLQPVEKSFPQKEQQKLLQLITNATTENQQVKKEIGLRSSSGKIIYAEAIVSPVLYKGKAAWLFTMTDTSEKKVYRDLLEEAIDLEIKLRNRNQQLKNIAYLNFHLARKPLANILGLVNVMDQTFITDQTLAEAIEFLKESGNELDGLIKGLDPQLD